MKATTFFAAMLALLLLSPGMAQAVLSIGDQAPDFSIPDTAWVNQTLSQYRGKVVLLQFWQQF